MTLADATSILYGPVPLYVVVVEYDDETLTLRCLLTSRNVNKLIDTETRPCSIFVDGLLVRRVKR